MSEVSEIVYTKEELDQEVQKLVTELGRNVYHAELLNQDIQSLKNKIFELNVKAFKLDNPGLVAQDEEATEDVDEEEIELEPSTHAAAEESSNG